MCGIFGIYTGSGADLAPSLDAATDRMVHRGPDARGTFTGRSPDDSWQVGLGHRRLAIVDIAASPQPMASVDGRYTIVFNGEIYNYVELRAALERRGHRFATNGDTEVILEAYRAWGSALVDHLRGMFAFILWDSDCGRLFAARDPFGVKPLFVTEGAAFHAFASEIDPLLRLPQVDDALDWNSLREYFQYRYVPGPATFFRRIRKVPPGTFSVVEDGAVRSERYFTTPFSRVQPDIADFEEATRRLEATLDEAVRLRLRSEAPFGAYLSGGLDSSVVVALMQRHMSERLSTFSVGFDEKGSSELPYARQVAQAFGTDHHECIVSPDDFADAWREAVERRGAPVAEPSDLPILLLSKMARRSVKMVLTGEGADELLGGYPKHRAEPWVVRYQSVVPALLHERVLGPAVRSLPYAFRRLKVLSGAAGIRDAALRMGAWFGGVDAALCQALYAGPAEMRALDLTPFQAERASPLKRMLHFDQTSWLPDNLLERGDRMLMAGSIEGRLPFMDVPLAELVARFPDPFLTGAPKGKRVLRSLASRLLPREIIERKKVGFRVPVDVWFREGLADTLDHLLKGSASTVRQVCDTELIDRVLEEHRDGRQNHEKMLWTLATLEQFFRIHKP